MNQQAFSALIRDANQMKSLPLVLAYLQQVDELDIVEVANSLAGQFSIADVDGEKRIYHVTTELNDEGVETEYVEHVMNEDDDSIVFISWFFESYFDMKRKDIYSAAGRTYQQPKRH